MNTIYTSAKVLISQAFVETFSSEEHNDIFARLERSVHVKSLAKKGNVYLKGKWSSLLVAHDVLIDEFRNSYHVYSKEQAEEPVTATYKNLQSEYCLDTNLGEFY